MAAASQEPQLKGAGREKRGRLNKVGRPVSERQVRFDDFVLQFDTSSRGGFRARVLKSPFGEGVVGFSLPSSADMELSSQGVSGVSRDLSHHGAAPILDGRPPLEIGTELFRSVFQGQVRTLLDKSRGQLEISPNLGLRLKIKLDPSDEETGALADLPWELLCDGETEDFFALSRQTSLVRYLDVPRSSQPIPFAPPLRILAVGASPNGLQALNLEEEVRRLEDLNRSSAEVNVQVLPHASAGAVREALAGDTFNVLHFMGHGTFDRASGEGMLAFEGPGGSLDLVSGKAFATKLRDLRSLGVVVLNACNTARARQEGGANPFRGVATALVLGGVPAVVAMQRPISDRAAIGFSTAFYRHLARGDSIDEALTEGRQAIHSAKPEEFEWATPVLFLRMPEGNVFVAKPAERPKQIEPAPPPRKTSRGSAFKIAAGTAGAGLLVFGIYAKFANTPATPTLGDNKAVGGPQKPSAEPPSDQELSPKQGGDTGQRSKVNKDRKEVTDAKTTTQDSKAQASIPAKSPSTNPVPEPAKPQESLHADVPAGTLSSISAQALSIARIDGGLRVTVSFTNAGGGQSVRLSMEHSILLDNNNGLRYPVVDSDLPVSEPDLRLDLPAGSSYRHTFDFQAPKAGAKKLDLALLTPEGQRIKISGSSLTLPDSP
jgi:hypothetical protein